MSGAAGKNREQVLFTDNPSRPGRFLPQVLMEEDVTRPFEGDDMPRVSDFEGAIEGPADSALRFDVDNGTENLKFPKYHFCLRGGFLFYFKKEDVDEESGPFATYHDRPVGLVPLDGVTIEFPPGGRRVFREHAQTDARTGYELVILHANPRDGQPPRPPAFLVADSLTQREKWAVALRARADADTSTWLRAGYSSTARKSLVADDKDKKPISVAAAATVASFVAKTTSIRADKVNEAVEAPKAQSRRTNVTGTKPGAAKSIQQQSIQQQVLQVSDDPELAEAVVEFGVAQYDEKEWIDHFFSQNNDFDAPSKCRQMDDWQNEMKRNLKGAVLEQYEYFVQASGEMTTMGLEVSSLKTLIEKQVETLKQMKQVDFSSATPETLDGDELMGRSLDDDRLPVNFDPGTSNDRSDDQSIFGEDMSSLGDAGVRRNRSADASVDDGAEEAPPIEVPDWLDDVTEEIAATMRECRYNDAIDLYLKGKTEVGDLMDKHNRPTAYRLTKKQRDKLRAISRELATLGDRISERLEQSLRRKNEAMRQAFKRERADLNAIISNPVSPCALTDDAFYLQLLVKLGRNNEAAEAYAARRSLLLLETLHERPISGAGSIDLVIYAAQLSQSFFSCLASSVEGFLDLFLTHHGAMNGDKAEDFSIDTSSVHSQGKGNLPAGAVASLVLWCDSELTKFAIAFGGARVLANLALSPPPRDAPKQPRIVGGGPADDAHKERKNALDVAAQCIDQAFMYASNNLDGVGLPLTPRLAECIRMRLKGCEGEISHLLDERWQHLTAEWRSGDVDGGMVR